jgi:superfamily I DNA/RNA helicase
VAQVLSTSSVPQRARKRQNSRTAGASAAPGSSAIQPKATQKARPKRKRSAKSATPAATEQLALAPEFAPPPLPTVDVYQPSFIPSHYQVAIFDFVQSGVGDGIVDAKAGSGKTSTLVECARFCDDREALFLAFNVHIADELARRLTGTTTVAKTIHKVGYACLARYFRGKLRPVDEGKYKHLAREIVSKAIAALQQREHALDLRERRGETDDAEIETLVRVRRDLAVWDEQRLAILYTLADFAHYARVSLTDPHDLAALEALDDHFHIIEQPDQMPANLLSWVAPLIDAGVKAAEDDHLIDFDDMLYLPYLWELTPSQASMVYLDEAQDLSAAQLALALKCRAPGGRLLAVGDEHQAIYGFAGADNDSFWNIQRATGATLLPLSICYRCPTSHLTLAQEIVPDIEPRPDAPEGVVGIISEDKLASVLQGGDLILCRVTAPLVRQCIKLIGQRVPARVRGRDIGKGISDLIRQLQAHPTYTSYTDLLATMEAYEAEQVVILSRRKNGASRIASLRDRLEALRICYEQFPARDAESLRAQINDLFSDSKQLITLSTVHRAKGDEADRVFILRRDKMPLSWVVQLDWERRQEMNILYVALTRAKRELWFVEEGSLYDRHDANDSEPPSADA